MPASPEAVVDVSWFGVDGVLVFAFEGGWGDELYLYSVDGSCFGEYGVCELLIGCLLYVFFAEFDVAVAVFEVYGVDAEDGKNDFFPCLLIECVDTPDRLLFVFVVSKVLAVGTQSVLVELVCFFGGDVLHDDAVKE